MKIRVHIGGEWLLIPLRDETVALAWVAQEAVRRYKESRLGNLKCDLGEVKIVCLRLASDGALLSFTDRACDTLTDGTFVLATLEGEPAYAQQLSGAISAPLCASYAAHNYAEPQRVLYIDGESLKPHDLMRLGRRECKIQVTAAAWQRITDARFVIDSVFVGTKPLYGINTGFGKNATIQISNENLSELQLNLIRSHAAGVGPPLELEQCRMLFALRINVLAKGYSGVSPSVLKKYIRALNANCIPWIPSQGSVGASGDLAPLAHLALGLLGEGCMWSPKTGWANASLVLEANGLKPITLAAKDGLALINGTQMITAIGVEAMMKAEMLAKQADVVAAFTLEVLKGTTRAFDPDIYKARPHPGQRIVAQRFRSLLHSQVYPSEVSESHRFCDRVQDAYTLRCCAQVHGIVHDTIKFVKGILVTEMNSATDNPMVFTNRGEIISGGNFHGEYPAKVCDYLSIAIHEIGSISERRSERLVNPAFNGLPAFLVENSGLNSGLMMAHVTAAALVSENKTLTHPASVDSLTTSGGTEDHVSMGPFAARKARMIVQNVAKVMAIELLCACQALEFLRPMKTTEPLERVYELVRTVSAPWDKDRFLATDIDAVTLLIESDRVWEVVKDYVAAYIRQENTDNENEDKSFEDVWRNKQGSSPTCSQATSPLVSDSEDKDEEDDETTNRSSIS